MVTQDHEAEGSKVMPKRWIVERAFFWIGRDRRMGKDCEQKVQTSG